MCIIRKLTLIFSANFHIRDFRQHNNSLKLKNKIENKKLGFGCALFFILPFFLIGIITLYISLSNLYFQIETNNWVPVIAKIKNVEIVATASNISEPSISYETKCNYTYTYNNKKYTNNIISIGYGSNNTENHQELYRILKYSSSLTAYVNPDKPNNSTLVQGINSSTTSLLIFSILWNSFIILFLKAKNNKRLIFIFVTIFIGGLVVIISGISHTNFNKKINIIKKKSEREIEQMKDKELQEMIEQSRSNE